MTSPTSDHRQAQDVTRPAVDLIGILLSGPNLDDTVAEVFAEVEAERKADFGRA